MGQGYFRNQDDSVSDPELIAGRYKIGRSVFFEVSLVLAEYADAQSSASGGSSSQTPSFIEAGGLEIPEGPTGGCPATDQYVWINDGNAERPRPRAVKASSLVGKKRKKDWLIYVPFGGMFLDFDAEILENQPLIITELHSGIKAKTSVSHKIIDDLSNLCGTFQTERAVNQPQLACEMVKVDGLWQMDLKTDRLKKITKAGKGDVVKITIKTSRVHDMLYACGEDKMRGVLSHNRKRED